MSAVRCATPGCHKPTMIDQIYCALCLIARRLDQQVKAEKAEPPKPATEGWPDPMANLSPALKAMLPGEPFTLTFYGRPQSFLFEAWEGHYFHARPVEQVGAVVRVPITDLTRFNARTGY